MKMKFSDFELWDGENADEEMEEMFTIDATPYKAYKLLKANFGACKYIGEESDNEGFYYQIQSKNTGYGYNINYTIESGFFWTDSYIRLNVYKKKGGTSWVSSEVRQLVQLIEKEAKRMNWGEESETSLYLFQNPFHLYFSQARQLIEMYNTNRPNNATYLAAPFFLLMAAFEGFLNLIYELYLDQSLRDDKRIKDQIFRSPIDLKLRSAPLYCMCFKARTLLKIEPFGKFQAIVNLRNDLIHGNLTPTMRVREYVEDDLVFWLSDSATTSKYGLPASAQELYLHHIDFVFEAIEEIVESILSNMNGQQRLALSQVLHTDQFYARFIGDEFVIESS